MWTSKTYRLMILLLMLMTSVGGWAQSVEAALESFNQQSDVKSANRFFEALDKHDFTDELIVFNADKAKDSLRLQVWYWAAEWFYDRQQYEQAEVYGLKAKPLSEVSGQEQIHGDLLSLMALIYVREGHFEKAAQYAKECNDLDLKAGNPDNIASSFNTLAGIYMSMRQTEEAEKYILKAIDYAKQVDNPQRLAVLHGMASEVYHKLNQEERSLDYATKAYEMEKQLGRKDKMAVRQAQRAAALISLKQDAEAKEALAEAIPGLRESQNIHSLGIACNQMGQLMHQEQNDSAAVRYFNEALDIFTSQHDLFNEAHSRKGLYEALRHTDPEQAMAHNDRYNELRDSIYDKDTGELLSKYAAEYGYGELQAENANMRSTYHLYIIIGIAVVVLLLAQLAYGAWRSRRDRQRIQELIREISLLRESPAEAVEPVKALAEPVSEEKPEVDETPEADRQFLLHLIEVVNASLPTGHYGVEEIASRMNMSVQTFRRRLLAVTGESPKAFISAIQMELAAKLLKDNPDMTISQIANRCGYDEATSFGRTFRKAYGISPSQYREKA